MTPTDTEVELLRKELAATREVIAGAVSEMRTWMQTRCVDHQDQIKGLLSRERERDEALNKLFGKIMAYSVLGSMVIAVITSVIAAAIISRLGV